MEEKIVVLVVDDAIESLDFISDTLIKENFIPVTAKSGMEALDILKSTTPDVILLDVVMPNMDGYELCRLIRAKDEFTDVPVLFITGKTEPEEKLKGFEVGGSDYIAKPFGIKELSARINVHGKLKKALSEMKKIDTDKSRFIATVIKELKLPLSHLVSHSETMLSYYDKFEKEKLKKYSERIHKYAMECQSILESMLDWTRTKAQQKKFNPEVIDFDGFIRKVIQQLSDKARKKKIIIQAKIQPNIEIYADKGMIENIINDMIISSIRNIPNEGLIIIGACDYDEDDSKVEFHITDTGEMFSPDVIEIIEKDFQDLTSKELSSANENLLSCKDMIKKNNGIMKYSYDDKKRNKLSVYFQKAKGLTEKDIIEEEDETIE